MVIKANDYLLKQQHYKYGDWIIHNPLGVPGGWGFADSNTIHPDVDDTTASFTIHSEKCAGKLRHFANHGKKGFAGRYRCKMTMEAGLHLKKIQTANY